MARFRAVVIGGRGSASRLGTVRAPVEARVNGWDVGVRVIAEAVGDADVFYVYATGGSNGGAEVLIGTIGDEAGAPRFSPAGA